MKKTIFLLILAVGMLNVSAREKEKSEKSEKQIVVPEIVKKAFDTKFANATEVEWGMEKPGEYEVEFELNSTDMSALFDTKGVLIETETEIKKSDLPNQALTLISTNYKEFKVSKIEKLVNKDGVVTFEATVKNKSKAFELVFDSNGKLLKKESIQNEEDND